MVFVTFADIDVDGVDDVLAGAACARRADRVQSIGVARIPTPIPGYANLEESSSTDPDMPPLLRSEPDQPERPDAPNHRIETEYAQHFSCHPGAAHSSFRPLEYVVRSADGLHVLGGGTRIAALMMAMRDIPSDATGPAVAPEHVSTPARSTSTPSSSLDAPSDGHSSE